MNKDVNIIPQILLSLTFFISWWTIFHWLINSYFFWSYWVFFFFLFSWIFLHKLKFRYQMLASIIPLSSLIITYFTNLNFFKTFLQSNFIEVHWFVLILTYIMFFIILSAYCIQYKQFVKKIWVWFYILSFLTIAFIFIPIPTIFLDILNWGTWWVLISHGETTWRFFVYKGNILSAIIPFALYWIMILLDKIYKKNNIISILIFSCPILLYYVILVSWFNWHLSGFLGVPAAYYIIYITIFMFSFPLLVLCWYIFYQKNILKVKVED